MQNKIHPMKQFVTHYMHDHLQDLGNKVNEEPKENQVYLAQK